MAVYNLYHAIIVTARYGDDYGRPWIEVAHAKAKECFYVGFGRLEDIYRGYVSDITPGYLNGVRSFAVFPSGTDYNREEADEEQVSRHVFVEWLHNQSYGINKDGEYEGSPLTWVVLSYGADEGEPPEVIADDGEPGR